VDYSAPDSRGDFQSLRVSRRSNQKDRASALGACVTGGFVARRLRQKADARRVTVGPRRQLLVESLRRTTERNEAAAFRSVAAVELSCDAGS